MALHAAIDIRLYAVKEYGRIIHEFDPWFHFRATEYLVTHGWHAFYREGVSDTEWKPLIASETRPTYQQVEDALKAADVPFRLTEFDAIV